METQKLISELSKLEKVEIQFIILKLMNDNKIQYQDITEAYVEHLKFLKEEMYKEYNNCIQDIMEMWTDKKQNRTINLKKTMHHLLDNGRINTTHEDIDKHK